MMMRYALAAMLLLASFSANAQPITGEWLTDDKSAVIHVEMRDTRLWGMIARVLDPAAPARDTRNPDPTLRTRSLVGTPVLINFSQSAKGWDAGQAYDPKAGRSYRSSLALDGHDKLNVTGCVVFICRTKTWTRLRN